MAEYIAFTDGACLVHTTRCGAYAARVIGMDDSVVHVCETTSQRMEIAAIIEALDMVPPGSKITVYTDSEYAVGGFSGRWRLKKNLDLWERLHDLAAKRDVTITHIPRCSVPDHAAVDRLANASAKRCV